MTMKKLDMARTTTTPTQRPAQDDDDDEHDHHCGGGFRPRIPTKKWVTPIKSRLLLVRQLRRNRGGAAPGQMPLAPRSGM